VCCGISFLNVDTSWRPGRSVRRFVQRLLKYLGHSLSFHTCLAVRSGYTCFEHSDQFALNYSDPSFLDLCGHKCNRHAKAQEP
jgi:hypothetical protein